MGLLKRLFSLGSKSKNKEKQHDRHPPLSSQLTSTSTGELLQPSEQDTDLAVNRLLRSSSTHFSVIKETEYLSAPPIPHPINNVLRTPSVLSSTSKQSTSSYSVTIRSRTVHSRTEFPNANGRTPQTPKSPRTPSRARSAPPLTPGDRHRLSKLKQDASVLSLLNIYDEAGQPAPKSFSNTPALPKRNNSTLRALLGDSRVSSAAGSRTSLEESDLSWAERYIANAGVDTGDDSSSESVIDMPTGLFAAKSSPERHASDNSDSEGEPGEYPDASFLTEVDNGEFDSMLVEVGTLEEGLTLSQPANNSLPAAEFFKFLSESAAVKESSPAPPPKESLPPTTPPCPPSSNLKPIPNTPRGPRTMGSPSASIQIRHGPRELQAQVSPAPRRRQNPPPLPPIPSDFQFKSPRGKATPLEHRSPTNGLTRNSSNRTVSVASSVHPEIETAMDLDPYTPVPIRIVSRKRARPEIDDEENLPPNLVPAAPLRGRVRKYPEYAQENRNKQSVGAVAGPSELPPSPKRKRQSPLQEQPSHSPRKNLSLHTTPMRNPTLSKFQTPLAGAQPSPASSTELSPEGRRIMASVRAEKRKFGDMLNRTPRAAWQSWSETLQDPQMQ